MVQAVGNMGSARFTRYECGDREAGKIGGQCSWTFTADRRRRKWRKRVQGAEQAPRQSRAKLCTQQPEELRGEPSGEEDAEKEIEGETRRRKGRSPGSSGRDERLPGTESRSATNVHVGAIRMLGANCSCPLQLPAPDYNASSNILSHIIHRLV